MKSCVYRLHKRLIKIKNLENFPTRGVCIGGMDNGVDRDRRRSEISPYGPIYVVPVFQTSEYTTYSTKMSEYISK